MAYSFYGLIGRCEKMQQLFTLLEKVAEDDISTVLIQGESGTGKELVAKAIHAHSPRARGHFVPVNCAAIPEDLLESELFGHTRGAFTGAISAKTGRIEYADGGTLFLDEIGDMKPVLQAKLLRVLQEREFEPVGGLRPIPVDVRVIAATHRNLEQLVAEGTFREDLYYRLSVIPVTIPPLRDRLENLELLLNHFIEQYGQRRNKKLAGFSSDALETLSHFYWKGNVRELENFVQHMTILHSDEIVTLQDLPEKYLQAARIEPQENERVNGQHLADQEYAVEENASLMAREQWPNEGIDFNTLVNDFETKLIQQALRISKGNKKEAARILNLKRTTLLEKIKKKDIESFPDI